MTSWLTRCLALLLLVLPCVPVVADSDDTEIARLVRQLGDDEATRPRFVGVAAQDSAVDFEGIEVEVDEEAGDGRNRRERGSLQLRNCDGPLTPDPDSVF